MLGYELAKVVRLRVLWVFLGLCVAFNMVQIADMNSYRAAFNTISQLTATHGQRVNEALIRAAQASEVEGLKEALADSNNVFDGLDTASLSKPYEHIMDSSPMAKSWMRAKYARLQPQVDHLAQSGAALDVYAGPLTHDVHSFLFGTLLRSISAQSCIMAALIMLYLVGYERLYGMQASIGASRVGRSLWRTKVIVGLGAGLVASAVLMFISLGVWFALWDYAGVWQASVSSSYNYVVELGVIKPFITWGDMTVASYLGASLGIILAMTAISGLVGAIVALVMRSVYPAALVLLVLIIGYMALMTFVAYLEYWPVYQVLNIAPVTLWLSQNLWFTDMGLGSVLPWQETITAGLYLVIGAVGTSFALGWFARQDVRS